jgi:general secretion pathway protein E
LVRKLIGQILIERNLLTPLELQNGLALQRERKEKIGKILLDLGYLAERDLMSAVAEQHKTPFLPASEFPAVPLELDKLSGKFLKQFRVLPLDLEGNVLTAAMADPSDTETLDSIRLFTGYVTKVRLANESDICEALDRFYGSAGRPADDLAKLAGDYAEVTEDIEHLRDMASEVPVIRLVNNMISELLSASQRHSLNLEKNPGPLPNRRHPAERRFTTHPVEGRDYFPRKADGETY